MRRFLRSRGGALWSMVRGERALAREAVIHRRGLGRCAAVLVIGAAVVFTLSARTGMEPGVFTRDPADLRSFPPYLGVLSVVGLMLWASAATLAFFGASLVKGTPRQADWRDFLLASGTITVVLLVDDAFMFHEWLFPKVLGIREYQVFTAYLVAVAAYLAAFLPRILSTSYVYLVASLALFSVSMGMDKLLPFDDVESAFEDFFKFEALVLWLAYHGSVVRLVLTPAPALSPVAARRPAAASAGAPG